MKKFLIAVLALVAFTSVHAEDNRNFVRAEGVFYDIKDTDNDKYGVNLQVGREVAPGVKVDIKQEFRNEENTQKTTNRFEVGGTYEQKVPFVKVGVRGAIGEKYVAGDNFEYWLVEPFVAYDVTNDWSVKGSWRYRNAFDSDKHDATNTYKATVAYKYTTNTSFDVSLGKTTGDSEYTSAQAGVTYKF